jgi:hypothetical protein
VWTYRTRTILNPITTRGPIGDFGGFNIWRSFPTFYGLDNTCSKVRLWTLIWMSITAQRWNENEEDSTALTRR